jgi:hypothetical protein
MAAVVTVTMKDRGKERKYALTFDEMVRLVSRWDPSKGVLDISF